MRALARCAAMRAAHGPGSEHGDTANWISVPSPSPQGSRPWFHPPVRKARGQLRPETFLRRYPRPPPVREIRECPPAFRDRSPKASRLQLRCPWFRRWPHARRDRVPRRCPPDRPGAGARVFRSRCSGEDAAAGRLQRYCRTPSGWSSVKSAAAGGESSGAAQCPAADAAEYYAHLRPLRGSSEIRARPWLFPD
jgi:hypothetical protein